MTMRIGLSASVIQRGKSGVATYVAGLLDGLCALQWPVEVTIFGLEADREWFAPWLDHCHWVPVPEKFRPAVKNILWHQTALRGQLRAAGCDVLHIPSYRRIVAAPGCAQVVTIHDCAPFRLAGKYDWARMFYGRQVVTRLARRAQRIIAVSQTTAADVRQFFSVPDENLTVIYNGIHHDLFRPVPPGEIAARLPVTRGWNEQGGWWIYVARLEHPGKNHLRLIRAFERLYEKFGNAAGRLVLAGADWHGAEVIHQAAANSPANDRIYMAGFVKDDDLPAWYSGANALVFPSLFEGFGLPPIEAMACGCPVVSSDRGSLGEVVGDAARIFDPEREEEIFAAMAEILEKPELRQKLRAAGFARAAIFRWERCARETCEQYRNALQALQQKNATFR